MSFKKKIYALLIFVLVATISLSAQKRLEDYEPESLFKEAKMLFDNQNYSSAAELFHKYLELTEDENTQKTVEAKFYEAACSSYMGVGEQQLMLFSKENPTSTFATRSDLLYANMLFKNKKYRDAVKEYEAIEEEGLSAEEKAEFYFKKGLAYYQINNIEKAEPLFYKAAFIESPYKDDARYYYAHIQYVNKKYEDARFNFKKIENSPKYRDIVPLYMMQIDYVGGDFTSVTNEADKVLENAKGQRKVEIALIIAESWYQQQDYDKALGYYNIARSNTRKAFPREVEFHIGFCKMKKADFEGAITNFQEATKKRNDDILAQHASYYLAQCYMKTNQEKFARNAYLAAYKADFDHEMSEDALFNYAKLSFIAGVDPFNEAVAQLKDYIDKNPSSPRREEAQMMIIHLYLNNKEYTKAIWALERFPEMNAEMQKIYVQLTYSIGINKYSYGIYDEAVEYLTKTIKNKHADPKLKAEALYWLADSYLQEKENTNAENYYMAFLKSEGSGQSEMLPLAYYNLGYIAYYKGSFPAAVKNFSYFVNMAKADKEYEADAWMRIGDCYFMERNYQKAIVAYSNSMKLDKKNGDYALFQQGMGYGALGDMNAKVESMDKLTKGYKTSSFYDRAMYEKGMAHLSTNDERSAIAAFSQLVNERPRSVYARQGQMKIGMLYYNNNQYPEALTALKKVIDNYPNTEESREALNIMRNIYMEQNQIAEFYKYTEEKGIATSVTEQDSISFATAENFFQQGQYEDALKAVNQYIKQFPKGAYLLKANYYGYTSLEKMGRLGIAERRPYFEYIASQPDNDYTDNALLELAFMEGVEKHYAEEKAYYERVLKIAENQKVKMRAVRGLMQCEYYLGNYDAAIERSNQLAEMPDLDQYSKNLLNEVAGMSLYNKHEYSLAIPKLQECAKHESSIMGAGAAYHVVLAYYNLGNYDEAENAVFYISDNFGKYNPYHVALSFIVLSDVYVAKGNIFQAKATLQSIIDNYTVGGPKDLAIQKLAAIEKEELKNEEDAE
ncbi:MAG: tetratricopeptide repeat protein [Bacteroidales bacterium]|nr:tetratricopeptide repeat protein [Bacteroidales bacterium]